MILTVMTRSTAIEMMVHQDFFGVREGVFCSVSEVGRRRRGVDSWASISSLGSMPSGTPFTVVGSGRGSLTASSLVSSCSTPFGCILWPETTTSLAIAGESRIIDQPNFGHSLWLWRQKGPH